MAIKGNGFPLRLGNYWEIQKITSGKDQLQTEISTKISLLKSYRKVISEKKKNIETSSHKTNSFLKLFKTQNYDFNKSINK